MFRIVMLSLEHNFSFKFIKYQYLYFILEID